MQDLLVGRESTIELLQLGKFRGHAVMRFLEGLGLRVERSQSGPILGDLLLDLVDQSGGKEG